MQEESVYVTVFWDGCGWLMICCLSWAVRLQSFPSLSGRPAHLEELTQTVPG